MKALQAEYAKLLSGKKKAYGEYQKAKKEMQETVTAKANVDRILGEDMAHLKKKNHRNKDNLSCDFISTQRVRSHTIYCVFSGDWGYSPTSRFAQNPVWEF